MDDVSGFWGLAKNRLHKFRGLHKSSVYLHVKECEGKWWGRGGEGGRELVAAGNGEMLGRLPLGEAEWKRGLFLLL